jgi:hypothetical protein
MRRVGAQRCRLESSDSESRVRVAARRCSECPDARPAGRRACGQSLMEGRPESEAHRGRGWGRVRRSLRAGEGFASLRTECSVGRAGHLYEAGKVDRRPVLGEVSPTA